MIKLTAYIGDSTTLTIPLTWQDAVFVPGSDWALIFTAKTRLTDPDASAVIQKTSGAGITVATSNASVVLVPGDTIDRVEGNLYFDIQAQNVTDDSVRTVAIGRIALSRDATRELTTSVPVITTETPLPYGPPLASLLASDNTWTGVQTFSSDVNFNSACDFTDVTVLADATFSSYVTFNGTSFTFGTGAGAAFRTALGLGSLATLSVAPTATAALGLKSATTTVDVASSTAPTTGQVLTATSTTAATWQTPSTGSTYTFSTGLTNTAGTVTVNASQTQITSVGTLTSLATSGNVGAGAATLSNARVNIAGTLSGAASVYGVYTGSITLSPGAGNSAVFQYFGGTVNTAGNTIAASYGAYSSAVTKSGAGTITNHYGFYQEANASATNNYGAYFADNVGIGIAAPTSKLHVNGTMTVGTSGFFTVSTAGAVGIPTATISANGAASTPPLSIVGAWLTSAGAGSAGIAQCLISNGGTWSGSTSGTGLGLRAPSGFTGNLIDAQDSAGASKFSVSSMGAVTLATALPVSSGGTGGTTTGAAWTGLGGSGTISSPTFSAMTTSGAATASTASILTSGTVFTGGSTLTTLPKSLIQPAVNTYTGVTGVAATDILTATGHAFANGDAVGFTAITGGTGLSITTRYFVISVAANTFQLSLTSGGAAINFTTDITAGTITNWGTWSTAGTMLGVNATSAFTGDLLNLGVNGSSVLNVTSAGDLTARDITTGTGRFLTLRTGAVLFSNASGNVNVSCSRLNFTGGTTSPTASVPAFAISGTTITACLGDGTAGGSFVASGTLSVTPTTQNGAGALSVAASSIALTTTGVANALTLANGTNGQLLTICHVSRGGGTGTAVLTPTTANGYTTITFTATGDSVTLQYHTTGGWHIVGSRGVTIA